MKFSQRFKFSDWPNRDIPLVTAGVYAIWHDDKLIYCGMSGREIEKAVKDNKKKYGLTSTIKARSMKVLRLINWSIAKVFGIWYLATVDKDKLKTFI